jgi:hypothetical protein
MSYCGFSISPAKPEQTLEVCAGKGGLSLDHHRTASEEVAFCIEIEKLPNCWI